MTDRPPDASHRLFWTVFGLFAVIAGGLLLLEHRAHLTGDWFVIGLLLVCVFGHGLMHGQHRH